MRGSLAIVAALLFAAMGSAVAIYTTRSEERSAGAANPETSVQGHRLASLERRVEELVTLIEQRSTVAREVAAPKRLPVAEQAGTSTEVTDALASIEKRLDELERRVAEPRDRVERAQLRNIHEPTPAARLQMLDETIRQGNDPASTPEEMLIALSTLRGQTLEDGSDARLPVLPSMIELARVSDDGEVRADVWRQLSGVTAPELLNPLLYALANDEHAKAREEAAETLADYMPDPLVESALRYAFDNDADRGVRRQAVEGIE
jgi:hypothetical protein